MNKTTRILVFSAMCIALASITSMIKVFEFPTGGSITLASTLFAVLPGYFFGPAVGIVSGFAYGILQFFLGPYILTPVQVFIDYGLAFAAFGLSGFFASKKYGLHIGYLAACVGRWFFAFLSGWIFFGEYAWVRCLQHYLYCRRSGRRTDPDQHSRCRRCAQPRQGNGQQLKEMGSQ